MTELESDLARWREDWQDEPSPAAVEVEALRRRAQWRSRGLVVYLGSSLVLTVGGLVAVLMVALSSGLRSDWILLAGFVVLFSWVMQWEIRSLRGMWRPEAETATAFLDLSIRRTRRWLGSLRVGAWMLAGEMALMLPWLILRPQEQHPERTLTLTDLGFGLWMLGVAAVLATGFLVWSGVRTRRRLARLEELRRSLDE